MGIVAQVDCFSINYSLQHSGLPVVETILLDNTGPAGLRSINVELLIDGYALPRDGITIDLPAYSSRRLTGLLQPELTPERLAANLERSQTVLEIRVDGKSLLRHPVWILSYNECSWHPGHERALPSFVSPNNPAVNLLTRSALSRFSRLTGMKSYLSLRESFSPEVLDSAARAVYESLRDEYDLVYDYEPPCWEAYSQRVRFPDEVIVEGKGTCWDIAILMASALEQILYASVAQPVIMLVCSDSEKTMHSLVGYWRGYPETSDPIVRDRALCLRWLNRGSMLLVDSMRVADCNPGSGERVGFDDSIMAARDFLRAATNVILLNMAAARADVKNGGWGVTPLPFRREPPYSGNALRALGLARRAWRETGACAIQGAHLLVGLLELVGGATSELFDRMSYDRSNPLLQSEQLKTYLTRGLSKRRPSSSQVAQETDSYLSAKALAKEEARRVGSLSVGDIHLLLALMRNPGRALSKAISQRNSSVEECLSYLTAVVPQSFDQPQSESFPNTLDCE